MLSLAYGLALKFLSLDDADLSLVCGDLTVSNPGLILDQDGSYARFARLVVRLITVCPTCFAGPTTLYGSEQTYFLFLNC